jgi:hypothetical protein
MHFFFHVKFEVKFDISLNVKSMSNKKFHFSWGIQRKIGGVSTFRFCESMRPWHFDTTLSTTLESRGCTTMGGIFQCLLHKKGYKSVHI